MTTDHPVEKLGTKVMNSLDWTVQAFVDARISTEALTSATRCCGVNFEGLGCQGRLDPGGRVQTPPAKGTVQRGKRQGRVSATTHDKKDGADRGGLRSRSGYHANDTWGTVLKEGARLPKQSEQNLNTLLNGSSTMLREHSTCWTWKVRRASSRQL